MEDCHKQTAIDSPISSEQQEVAATKTEKKKTKKKKKQPKPTYTKVKVLNKPRGPIATAIKTLKHPFKSTHASKDTDVMVIRVFHRSDSGPSHFINGGPTQQMPPVRRNFTDSCDSEGSVFDAETLALQQIERPPERREARRPGRVVRQCWEERRPSEVMPGCVPDDVDWSEFERPSNPTPLSARNLTRRRRPNHFSPSDADHFQPAQSHTHADSFQPVQTHTHTGSFQPTLDQSHTHADSSRRAQCHTHTGPAQLSQSLCSATVLSDHSDAAQVQLIDIESVDEGIMEADSYEHH